MIDASDSEDEDRLKKKIKLAGTAHSDMGERSAKPVVKINALDFNPTGAISFFYKMKVCEKLCQKSIFFISLKTDFGFNFGSKIF